VQANLHVLRPRELIDEAKVLEASGNAHSSDILYGSDRGLTASRAMRFDAWLRGCPLKKGR
jgi:hypothetical protein